MHETWRVGPFSLYTDSILIQRFDSSFILCASRGIQEITGFPMASDRSFFQLKENKESLELSLSPGASVSSIPCPAEPWIALISVWVRKAVSGMHLSEMWCSQHLSWAPCLACQAAVLPRCRVLGARALSGYARCWLLLLLSPCAVLLSITRVRYKVPDQATVTCAW